MASRARSPTIPRYSISRRPASIRQRCRAISASPDLRLGFAPDFHRDVAAFLGASYFRAVGGTMQYGLSARGLAVDCGLPRPEEFPDFVAYWFERPQADATTLVVHALLDSPSIAGAYRFEIAPGEPLAMRIDTALYPRKRIERLGVAPLTSMFLTAANDRTSTTTGVPRSTIRTASRCKPVAANGSGVRSSIRRPYTSRRSPTKNRTASASCSAIAISIITRTMACSTTVAQGLGRAAVGVRERRRRSSRDSDRARELRQHRRVVESVERRTARRRVLYAYRLYWGSKMPAAPSLAAAAMTWSGVGGQVGGKRAHFSWRFIVDFAGGELASLARDAKVEPVITLSRGTTEIVSARPLDSIKGWARCSMCGRRTRARSRSIFGCFCGLAAGPLRRRGFISGRQWRGDSRDSHLAESRVRHSGEGRISSVNRGKPESPTAVIPAKAGIHFDFVFGFAVVAITDSRPCVVCRHPWRPVTFSCLCKRK